MHKLRNSRTHIFSQTKQINRKHKNPRGMRSRPAKLRNLLLFSKSITNKRNEQWTQSSVRDPFRSVLLLYCSNPHFPGIQTEGKTSTFSRLQEMFYIRAYIETEIENPEWRGERKRNGPAREGRPDEVVVGEPVVENGDEGFPLGVPLFHRRLRPFPSLLHFSLYTFSL